MYNDLFSIGPFTVHTYGLMYAVGIFMACITAYKRGEKMGLQVSNMDSIAFWVVLSGLAGSKLLYWLTRIQDIPHDPSILYNLADGWVVYGGLIGGIAGGYIYCIANKLNFWKYFDLAAPSVSLAQGFGRLGCFFAGCCYGVETNAWYGIVFPEGSLAPAGIKLFPTQLVCSAFDFALFFLLCHLSKKIKTPGVLSGLWLMIYAAGRFMIEFFRGDLVRGGFAGLSTSQIISILMFSIGLLIMLIIPKIEGEPAKEK